LRDLNEGARVLGQQIHILRASSERDIDAAFASLSALRAAALLVGAHPFFNSRREQIVTLASRYRIPAIYEVREFAVAGGLMSTERVFPTPIARWASTPGEFSRAINPPTYR
jgi:hypothetical protein